MHLNGIHHITAITADAQRNVDFYTRVLGLRLVKKTVNFDAPDYYHLYYGDELGAPGSIMTFFEFPDAPSGTAGAGMVHRIMWRVANTDALAFWADRLSGEDIATEEQPSALLFNDPEGLGLEIVVDESHDPPLVATSEIPRKHALLGLAGARAYTRNQEASHYLLTGALRFTALADNAGYLIRGGSREALYHYDPVPAENGVQGAGTVHHIAFASQDGEPPSGKGVAHGDEKRRRAIAARAMREDETASRGRRRSMEKSPNGRLPGRHVFERLSR